VGLAEVAVPAWLSEILGPEGSVAELDTSFWVGHDQAATDLDRIREWVLGTVKANEAALIELDLGQIPSRLDAQVSFANWPSRARNALARLANPDGPRNLTYGEVLRAHHVGIRTALEAACLLEMAGLRSSADSFDGTLPKPPLPQWGERGSSLLPVTLRRALADEALPDWLRSDLRLPEGATAIALDSTVWSRIEIMPIRVERFLVNLIAYRKDAIAGVRVLDGAWPAQLEPREVAWPTRLCRALGVGVLADRSRFESLTYGDLLSLPSVGVKTVLEWATMADAVVETEVSSLSDHERDELARAADSEWAERVRADDPRFRDVTPPHPGSLADLFEDALANPEGPLARALVKSLPDIIERAEEIASEPLDTGLRRILTTAGVGDRAVAMTFARYGWDGRGQRTLQVVADEFGITRERVRQIVSKSTDRLGRRYLPQLERALRAVADAAPLPSLEAAELLVSTRLSTTPVSPSSLLATADLFGYDVDFCLDEGDGNEQVLAAGAAGTGPVYAIARKIAGRVGVGNVDEVQAELVAQGQTYDRDAVSRLLLASSRIQFLDTDWFWIPDIPPERNRLRNVSRQMCSVAGHLDLQTIRQGLRRRYRFRGIDIVPPTPVLQLFYAAHPEFTVSGNGQVGLAQPLDYRDLLGTVERICVDVLRASPSGLLDRTEFERAVTARGVNANSFSVFTTYSAVLDHPATNIWSVRGAALDPVSVEALRNVLAKRTRHRRTLSYGWDEDGHLVLNVVLGNVNSPVISIPAAIARYVADSHFAASTSDGSPAGTITIDPDGYSWGYGPFLRRRGAEEGDAIRIEFDLATSCAVISMDDEAAFEDQDDETV